MKKRHIGLSACPYFTSFSLFLPSLHLWNYPINRPTSQQDDQSSQGTVTLPPRPWNSQEGATILGYSQFLERVEVSWPLKIFQQVSVGYYPSLGEGRGGDLGPREKGERIFPLLHPPSSPLRVLCVGKVLLRDTKPCAIILNNDCLDKYCSGCFKLLAPTADLRCGACRTMHYCSKVSLSKGVIFDGARNDTTLT